LSLWQAAVCVDCVHHTACYTNRARQRGG